MRPPLRCPKENARREGSWDSNKLAIDIFSFSHDEDSDESSIKGADLLDATGRTSCTRPTGVCVVVRGCRTGAAQSRQREEDLGHRTAGDLLPTAHRAGSQTFAQAVDHLAVGSLPTKADDFRGGGSPIWEPSRSTQDQLRIHNVPGRSSSARPAAETHGARRPRSPPPPLRQGQHVLLRGRPSCRASPPSGQASTGRRVSARRRLAVLGDRGDWTKA
jgi:hypothetical protein